MLRFFPSLFFAFPCEQEEKKKKCERGELDKYNVLKHLRKSMEVMVSPFPILCILNNKF